MKRWAAYSLGAVGFLVLAAPAFAWDGVNVDTGSTITIDDGTDISEGADIQVTDGDTGQQRNITITSITQSDSNIEMEVTDDATGDSQTFDFDVADMPDTLSLPEPQ